MASYWKSPYKEMGHSYNESDSSMEPFTLRNETNSARMNGERHAVSNSVHEWFDPPRATKYKEFHLSRMRSSMSRIKGILKTPNEVDGSGTGRSTVNSESCVTSRTDSTTPRREKKKVTFGLSESQSDGESISKGFRFKLDRSVSSHFYRLKNAQPLDEYAKQNLKKLLGFMAVSEPLPPVKGKAVKSADINDDLSHDFVKCRHSPDLRCARCFQENETKDHTKEAQPALIGTGEEDHTDEIKICNSNSVSSVTSNRNDQASKTMAYRDESSHITSDGAISPFKVEPMKMHNTHWTKSFIRSPLRRHGVRHFTGRHVRSANVSRKKWPGNIAIKQQVAKPPPHVVTDNLTELHITGDGKIIGIRSNGTVAEEEKTSNQGNSDKTKDCLTAPGSISSSGRFGYKIPATPTHLTLANLDQEQDQPPKSAPTRQKQGNNHDRSNPSFSRRVTDMEGYLDKTSQILTWLKDVRQKQNYVPRNARLYALEPQQLH